MTKTQQQQADDLIEAFSLFDDWEERYGYLIDLGKKLPLMNEADKTEETRILGCQSRVWLVPRLQGNGIEFLADSDSAIVRGLIAVLQRVYSGQPADKIRTFDIEGLLANLHLEEHLSPTRRNGLHSMVQRIQSLAQALSAAEASQVE